MNKDELIITKKCLEMLIEEKYELEDENIENETSNKKLSMAIECLKISLAIVDGELNSTN